MAENENETYEKCLEQNVYVISAMMSRVVPMLDIGGIIALKGERRVSSHFKNEKTPFDYLNRKESETARIALNYKREPWQNEPKFDFRGISEYLSATGSGDITIKILSIHSKNDLLSKTLKEVGEIAYPSYVFEFSGRPTKGLKGIVGLKAANQIWAAQKEDGKRYHIAAPTLLWFTTCYGVNLKSRVVRELEIKYAEQYFTDPHLDRTIGFKTTFDIIATLFDTSKFVYAKRPEIDAVVPEHIYPLQANQFCKQQQSVFVPVEKDCEEITGR